MLFFRQSSSATFIPFDAAYYIDEDLPNTNLPITAGVLWSPSIAFNSSRAPGQTVGYKRPYLKFQTPVSFVGFVRMGLLVEQLIWTMTYSVSNPVADATWRINVDIGLVQDPIDASLTWNNQPSENALSLRWSTEMSWKNLAVASQVKQDRTHIEGWGGRWSLLGGSFSGVTIYGLRFLFSNSLSGNLVNVLSGSIGINNLGTLIDGVYLYTV